jgi:hypothetical protein
MNRFQPFDFKTVGAFLDYLPEHELSITEKLRALIFESIPDISEKLCYNVPFYSRHSRICYIWPGSVPWGNIRAGVQIGFCKAHLLSDPAYLEKGTRKQVYTKTFFSKKDVDAGKLRQLLWEACTIDETFKSKKQHHFKSRP